MNKKLLRILYFFALLPLGVFGGMHISDTYLGSLHLNNAVLGWICLIVALVAFAIPIVIYSGRPKR